MLPIVEHWNGTAWTTQETPKLAASAELLAVSCASASACTATGQQGTAALAEHWNGTAWTVQATAEIAGAKRVALNAVSCFASNACTATGNHDGNTLAERWNGTTWAVQPTPNPTEGKTNELVGVSCPSLESCTATGSYYAPGKIYKVVLAESWNGKAWTIQEAPAPEGAWPEGGSILNGVSCTSATACEAVGAYLNGSGKEVTLGEVHS